MSNPRYDERTRGVTVQRVDFTALHDAWSAEAAKHNPEIIRLESSFSWAIGRDPKGGFHLICSEGVSWPIPPEDPGALRPAGYPAPVEIDLFDRSKPNMIAMFPEAVAKVTMEDLKGHVGEEVDLADFVRTFGARLETNFWATHTILTGTAD
jgi:hypothetical protein